MSNDIIRRELARRELATRDLLQYIKYCDERDEFKVGNFQKTLCEHIDAFIEAVERGGSPRLAIFAPPRHGKSEIVSRNTPAYVLGRHPEWEVIAASATGNLADDFGLWVSNRLNHPQHKDLFPEMQLDPSRNAVSRIRTLRNGGYTAVGVGAQVVGKGAHVGIVDDPVAGIKEASSQVERANLYAWYMANMESRLSPGGGMLLMHQRWTTDDLAACLLAAAKTDPNASQWTVLSFPAIATDDEVFRKKGEALDPGRWPLDKLIRRRADLFANGRQRDWYAMYQQSPHAEEGSFFKKDTVKYYDPNALPADLSWLVSADYAVTKSPRGDKTAIFGMGVTYDGDVYVDKDFWWGRWDSMEIVEKTVDMAKRLNARTLATEAGPIQGALKPLFDREMAKQQHYLTIDKNVRRASKIVVAHALRGLMEAGKLYFPNTPQVRDELMPNLLAFSDETDGDDDAVDSLSNGAICIENIGRPLPPIAPSAPSWRKPGEVYMEDLKWGKKKQHGKIPKLNGSW